MIASLHDGQYVLPLKYRIHKRRGHVGHVVAMVVVAIKNR